MTQVAAGTLWVVATPIGNLEDLSPRARRTLAEADLVLAEDTRHLRKLLSHFGIAARVRSCHEHNEARVVPGVLALLQRGGQVALASDAGTPLLADPGFRLVRRCRELGVPVRAVPGPSAAVAALSVAGLPPLPFTCLGFLPAGGAARRRALAQAATYPHTLVLFLSPHRLAAELHDCARILGGTRRGALLAELTKVHERACLASLAELAAGPESAAPRGEYTLVVGPPEAPRPPKPAPEAARQAVAEALAAGLPPREARRQAAARLGVTRRELYRLLLRAAEPAPEAPG